MSQSFDMLPFSSTSTLFIGGQRKSSVVGNESNDTAIEWFIYNIRCYTYIIVYIAISHTLYTYNKTVEFVNRLTFHYV